MRSRQPDCLDAIFGAIVAKLNEHFSRTAGQKLDMRRFLTVEVPLSPTADLVGREPIA